MGRCRVSLAAEATIHGRRRRPPDWGHPVRWVPPGAGRVALWAPIRQTGPHPATGRPVPLAVGWRMALCGAGSEGGQDGEGGRGPPVTGRVRISEGSTMTTIHVDDEGFDRPAGVTVG